MYQPPSHELTHF